MGKTPSRTSTIHSKAVLAIRLACLPAILLLANCNAPPPPQASTTTVVERPQVIQEPAAAQPTIAVDLGLSIDERKRRDDEQHRRDEEQRQHDDHPH